MNALTTWSYWTRQWRRRWRSVDGTSGQRRWRQCCRRRKAATSSSQRQ